MTRSKRFASIADIEDERRKQAIRQLADSENALRECQQILSQLETYRDDYLSAEKVSRTAQTNPIAMQDYQVFIARLDQAIRGQRELTDAALRECDDKRLALHAAHQRARSLDKVAERYRRQEALAEDRRTQRTLDEIGATMRQRPPFT